MAIEVGKNTKKRCGKKGCKKRYRFNFIKCRCGLSFCSKHFHPEDHDCGFCHKSTKNLEEKLVKVVADKVENRL